MKRNVPGPGKELSPVRLSNITQSKHLSAKIPRFQTQKATLDTLGAILLDSIYFPH